MQVLNRGNLSAADSQRPADPATAAPPSDCRNSTRRQDEQRQAPTRQTLEVWPRPRRRCPGAAELPHACPWSVPPPATARWSALGELPTGGEVGGAGYKRRGRSCRRAARQRARRADGQSPRPLAAKETSCVGVWPCVDGRDSIWNSIRAEVSFLSEVTSSAFSLSIKIVSMEFVFLAFNFVKSTGM